MNEGWDCRPRPEDLNLGAKAEILPPVSRHCPALPKRGSNLPESPDQEENLILEIIKKFNEDKFLNRLLQRVDKSTYTMKRNHLFRRIQKERNEKAYQDCLCKESERRCELDRKFAAEESYARSMQQLRDEEIRKNAFVKQLHACSPEIRDLEHELRRAYFAKTNYAQRLEAEALKLEEKMRERENAELLLERLNEQDNADQARLIAEAQKKKDYMTALKNQLEDHTSKQAKKEDEVEKDKAMIDDIIESIEKEQMEDYKERMRKVELYKSEINQYLQSREAHKEMEKQRDREEQEQIKKYTEKKEAQVAEFKRLKEAAEAAKAEMIAKAIEKVMLQQFKEEELEDLRRELYEEELAQAVYQKEQEEKDKRERQMRELRAAAEEAKKLRREKLEADRKEEEEYRKQLMEKFAADEKLEQMSYQKRRAREREHRKALEQLILERRCLAAQRHEKDQKTLDCADEEALRRQQLIDEERLKLLREHGPKLLGFLPRGIIKSQEELEKLGEPFLSYYKNQPLQPDPSTVDFDECEQEIFKNMQLPKYAKF